MSSGQRWKWLDQGIGVSQEAAKLIVLELFREDKISLGRAADLCQTPLGAFMEYAGKHGIPPHYGLPQRFSMRWERACTKIQLAA
jgi:predicted HTH domain antitoxin